MVTQLADMQNQIDQLRSDVDYLLSQVRELRGEAGIVETTPAPVTGKTLISSRKKIKLSDTNTGTYVYRRYVVCGTTTFHQTTDEM